MSNTGLIFPILVGFMILTAIILGRLDQWLEPKGSYEKWLEKKLEEEPDYINWLKVVDKGKSYKLGLKILKEAEQKQYKWYRKIGKILKGGK